MKESLRIGAVALLSFTVLCGLVYPALVYGVGQLAFSHRANGSLIRDEGRVVGSELVGQEFAHPGHFWSRRSHLANVAGNFAYDATTSSGANHGPSDAFGRPNPALVDPTRERIEKLHAAERAAGVPDDRLVPADLVTASASGLDPHISPAAAAYQVPRVAAVREVPADQVGKLVERFTETRTFGILGDPRVNVVLLNRALDAEYPLPR